MYLAEEEDRMQTILSGVPISAENIRLADQELGKQWHGTSWFFLMHTIAKTFTRVDEIPFSSIATVPQDYGIENWVNQDKLRRQLKTLTEVFNKRGLGNVSCNEKGDLSVGGIITHKDLNRFADSQYEYSMGEGLVRYSPHFMSWMTRKLSNFAERIWWHYTTAVYQSPKIYDSPEGENYLSALMTDLSARMNRGKLRFHDLEIWKDSQLEHSIPLLRGWERELISKEILKTFEIGEVSFITPRYFADSNLQLDSIGKVKAMSDLMKCLQKFPAYPVHLGNEKLVLLCQELERAGLVTKVTEPKAKYNVPHYAYLALPTVFQSLEREIKYSYSTTPMKEFGDVSLTDRIFRTLGRARLYAEKILPEVRSSKRDFKSEIEGIINSLEENSEADLGDIEAVFRPLTTLNMIQITDGKAVLNGEFGFVVKLLADFYYNLINEPELVKLSYPSKKEALATEEEQVQSQIELGLAKMFK